MSATTSARWRAADDGLGVVDHLGHRHPDRGLVAEHDLAERIADEQERDAGLVEDLRGRVVVGGQHRDARAVGVQLGDVDDGQAAWGSWCGAHAGSPLGCGRGDQSARPRRARPARAPRGRAARSATSRLDSSGSSSRDPSAARIVTRLVSVPKPGAGLGDVVGDEQVDALAAELLGGPLERAGLGREADQDRDGPERLAGRRAVAVEPVGDPGDLGQQVRRRLELDGRGVDAASSLRSAGAAGRKSATAAAITRASNPAAPSGAWVEPQQRRAQVGRRLDPDDGRRRPAAGPRRWPR